MENFQLKILPNKICHTMDIIIHCLTCRKYARETTVLPMLQHLEVSNMISSNLI